MGVWIEIFPAKASSVPSEVTPCMGVWIEIAMGMNWPPAISVTPCMGVWIEIAMYANTGSAGGSLPVWECGLKY